MISIKKLPYNTLKFPASKYVRQSRNNFGQSRAVVLPLPTQGFSQVDNVSEELIFLFQLFNTSKTCL